MILGKDSRSAATRAIIHQLNQAEGREHNLQNRPQNHSTKCGLNIGAGEGNRTLDIQLGKLNVLEIYQKDHCKNALFQAQVRQSVIA